jgi:hypothetical protein
MTPKPGFSEEAGVFRARNATLWQPGTPLQSFALRSFTVREDRYTELF